MFRVGLIMCIALMHLPVFAAPVLFVGRSHFDFGTVTQGERIEHVFEVENTGDEELVILKLTGS